QPWSPWAAPATTYHPQPHQTPQSTPAGPYDPQARTRPPEPRHPTGSSPCQYRPGPAAGEYGRLSGETGLRTATCPRAPDSAQSTPANPRAEYSAQQPFSACTRPTD